jgi:hypothetical protein
MAEPASGIAKLRMTVSPAATPAAGTVTEIVVPMAVAALVPIDWTNAIWARAPPAAASCIPQMPSRRPKVRKNLPEPIFMMAPSSVARTRPRG